LLAPADNRERWPVPNHFFVTARQEVGQTRDSPFRPRPAFIEVIDHGPKDPGIRYSEVGRWQEAMVCTEELATIRREIG